MPDLSFPTIPSNLLTPLFYADLDNSNANTGASTQRALIIGQMTSAGTGVVNTPLISQGATEAKKIGGQGSMLALMTAAYKAADSFGEVWYLPLADDPSAIAAQGSIAFTSAPTDTGVISFYIAGVLVNCTVTSTMTAANVATALVAAVAANPDLPVTAAVDATTTSKVDFVAKNLGAAAGDITLLMNYQGAADGEVTPPGLAYTITAMTGGAVNPSLAIGLANLVDKEFDFIAFPYTDTASLNAMKAFLSTKTGRWAYSQQLYGHAFSAYRGTLSSIGTFGNTRNDEHVSIQGCYNVPDPMYVWGADMAATIAVAIRADPARPVQTLALSTVKPPPLADRFDLPDRNVLLWDGISTYTVASDGTVQLENVVTTYQLNSFGVADDSYRELETMTTLTAILRRLKAATTSKFARMKLVDDATPITPGTNTVQPKTIKAEIIAEYQNMEADGLVQDSAAFAANLIVQKSTTNPNRVNVLYPAILINQLRTLAYLMQFQLQA